jgi:hypothetical protein
MADKNNTPPPGEGNHIRIDARRLIFEVRILLESGAQGLEALMPRPEAILIKDELGILAKFIAQAAEAVEAFSDVLQGGAA